MTTLLDMQIGVQRRVLGWLPEIAARRDARAIVGLGLTGAALANPAAASAATRPTAQTPNSNADACKSGPVNNIVNFIDYATKAIIAVIGALVLLRFAMAAWTMVASNKANRGKKALNDIMWVGAGLVVVVMIFPLRWGIIQVVGALFPSDAGAGQNLSDCATGASGGTGSSPTAR
jgi:hypothetical protein